MPNSTLDVAAHEPLWRRIIGPPSTRAGRWSAWLVGAVIGVLAGVGGLVAAGAPDLGWAALVALALSSSAGVLTAIVAGAIAVAAVFRGERSIVVLGPVLFGSTCFFFVLGLILQPVA
jgi:hypothetical protein